ncbi:MAG: hypothetical protein R2824_28140 [Saprospiraceae bacterium]
MKTLLSLLTLAVSCLFTRTCSDRHYTTAKSFLVNNQSSLALKHTSAGPMTGDHFQDSDTGAFLWMIRAQDGSIGSGELKYGDVITLRRAGSGGTVSLSGGWGTGEAVMSDPFHDQSEYWWFVLRDKDGKGAGGPVDIGDPIVLKRAFLPRSTDAFLTQTYNGLKTPQFSSEADNVEWRFESGIINFKKYEIGEFAQGGIIFWLDESGEHGLVAALNDATTSEGLVLISRFAWNAHHDQGFKPDAKAMRRGIYGGSVNTQLIIENYVTQVDEDDRPSRDWDFAAAVCARYNGGNYGDWYLPSIGELELMFTNLHLAGLGDFATESYWSSTQIDSGSIFAWSKNFAGIERVRQGKSSVRESFLRFRVRAVRSF